MGYIQRTDGLANFDKAVISLWFRIPQATLDTVRDLADAVESDFNDSFCGVAFSPPLSGVIPLITFGSIEETLASATPGGGEPVSPSFIGIDFLHETTPHVAVNLQTAIVASYNKAPTAPEDEYRPAVFYMQGWSDVDSQALTVVGDQWHHILISFDISPSCDMTHLNDWPGGIHDPPEETEVVTFGPTFSWAFDDEIKVGNSMLPSGGNVEIGGNENHIIPQLQTLGRPADYIGEGNSDFTVTYSGMEIAQSGNPIGVPASATFVDSVYNVIMAEVQVFTGVTLDLTVEGNRRLFVTSARKPVSPALAEAHFGKEPEIRFIGDWLDGSNSGTAGAFTKTGTTNSFTPTP